MSGSALLEVAQTAEEAANGRRDLLIWLPVLVILIVLAYVPYILLKRWMNPPDTSERTQGFSLSDLRALHKQGKISDEEFEKTRSMMVTAAKRMVSEVPRIKPDKPGPAQTPKAEPVSNPGDSASDSGPAVR